MHRLLINIRKMNEFISEDFSTYKNELKENGFCVLRNCLSIKFLKEVEKEVLKFSWGNIKAAEVNLVHTKNKSVLSSSHNLVENIENFQNLYHSKFFNKFYKSVLGSNPNQNIKLNSSYFFKSKNSKEIKIHQDNAYFNLINGFDCLTFYIPVHAQNKNSGTIFYFKGSHILGNLEHIPEGNLGASMCLKNSKESMQLKKHKVIYLDLRPGDIAIHNAYVVHGTLGNPKNNLCEAFNFSLIGESNKQDLIKYKKYKKLLSEFLVQKNK